MGLTKPNGGRLRLPHRRIWQVDASSAAPLGSAGEVYLGVFALSEGATLIAPLVVEDHHAVLTRDWRGWKKNEAVKLRIHYRIGQVIVNDQAVDLID